MNFETETIGGLVFCKAKERQGRKWRVHRWILLWLIYLGVCRVVIALVGQGSPFSIWLVIAPLALALAAAFGTYFWTQAAQDTLFRARLDSMPEGAFPCGVDIDGLGAVGWAQIKQGWLCFEGNRFGFRLKPSDIDHIYHEGYLNVGVRLPAEFPPLDFSLDVFRVRPRFTDPKGSHDALHAVIEWSMGDDPEGESLLPPISAPAGDRIGLHFALYALSLVWAAFACTIVALCFESIPEANRSSALLLCLVSPILALFGWWVHRKGFKNKRDTILSTLQSSEEVFER